MLPCSKIIILKYIKNVLNSIGTYMKIYARFWKLYLKMF